MLFVSAFFPCEDIKLEKMAPASHGHNCIVQVVEKRTVVDRESVDGRRMLLEEVLVADETGCMYLTARDGKQSLQLINMCPFFEASILTFYSTECIRLAM